MTTFVEALYKSNDKLHLGWNPESVTGITGYNLYVGQAEGSLSKLYSNINPQTSNNPQDYRKVAVDAEIDDVRTLLGLASATNFGNIALYWAITYIDSLGAESPIGDSVVVEIPPVGILGKTQKEDPSINRHIFGFSEESYRWTKIMASSSGGLVTSSSDFYAANTSTEYTYDSSGNVLTEKSYLSDRTSAGSPAKLITYTYGPHGVTSKVVTDSTV